MAAAVAPAAATTPRKSDPVLTSLTLSAGDLEPAFDPETTEYAMRVPYGTDRITFTVDTPSGATARVRVDGRTVPAGRAVRLAVGENTIKIVVTAGDDERTYTLTVVRSADDGVSYSRGWRAALGDIAARAAAAAQETEGEDQ